MTYFVLQFAISSKVGITVLTMKINPVFSDFKAFLYILIGGFS